MGVIAPLLFYMTSLLRMLSVAIDQAKEPSTGNGTAIDSHLIMNTIFCQMT